MLTPTDYKVDTSLIEQAIQNYPIDASKFSINIPTGHFFYDSWKLKEELLGTVWETIYDSLPECKGEARIITLEPGTNYFSHADIDDRWHLSLDGNQSYIIDLINQKMFKTNRDGVWYFMNAGRLHTAANFGQIPRRQLVVRKLLTKNTLKDPVKLELIKIKDSFDYRYQFDHNISPWLHSANKEKLITNFSYRNESVSFSIEKKYINDLLSLLGDSFGVKYN